MYIYVYIHIYIYIYTYIYIYIYIMGSRNLVVGCEEEEFLGIWRPEERQHLIQRLGFTGVPRQ